MTRIIFINRFFYPDQSATSQLLSDLAFELASDGHDTHVIASRAVYGQQGVELSANETTRGVHVHRVSAATARGQGLGARLAAYGAFYWGAAFRLRQLAQAGSIVVAKTDPPLLSILVMLALPRRRARVVNWLQDVYPEVAQRLGIRGLNGLVGRALTALRDRSLRQAAANVVLGERMQSHLARRGIAPASMRIIPNWIDDEAVRPTPAGANELRRQWGLHGCFVLGYSGNLGRAHEFQTVLDAAAHFKSRNDVKFLFVGGGFQHSALAQAASARGLAELLVFQPHQDQGALALSLGVPDAHWVSLLPQLEGLIVPSKVYGIAAAGRPIIAITAADGEIARLVAQYDCGAVIAPGDNPALTALIEAMLQDPALCVRWGANARAMLDAAFTRREALAKWRALIASLG